ncbi:hypothetical protein OKA05_27805 [Luteolibacter arcticus]|uniref:Uncharacterized protein n=1 Tax=Luteolibacter arcticus TaxID=1581411 RepID=A0ABT3GSE5_9BACT|nr:hypothetical protein [Luteolibacter arcticus]MCW1926388.1 hypothetical protein [Luteolibacter arcticus]
MMVAALILAIAAILRNIRTDDLPVSRPVMPAPGELIVPSTPSPP